MAYFISRYVQEVLHYSALQAGIAFVPFAVASAIASQLTSMLAARVNTMCAVTRVQPSDAGAASAVLSVMQQLGGAMGLGALAAISTSVTRFAEATAGDAGGVNHLHALADGFGTAFVTCAIFVILAGVISVIGLRTTYRELE